MVDMVNSFAVSESFDPVHVMVDMVNSFAVMRAFASTSYNSPGGKRRGGGVLARGWCPVSSNLANQIFTNLEQKDADADAR